MTLPGSPPPPPPPPSPPPGPGIAPRVRVLAAFLLAGLMLILALRMTGSEQIRDTLKQLDGRLRMKEEDRPVIVGPAIVVAESTLTFLIAGASAALAAASGGISRRRAGQFALLAAVLGCGIISMLQAGNRFNPAVGLADLGMAVVSGWSVAVLLPLVGEKGRRAMAAGLLAILTIWVGKGLLQKYVEFPDVQAFMRENLEQALRNAGIADDPVQRTLFISRAASGEVHGYLSFANVLASGLMGMLTVATAMLVAWIQGRRMAPPPVPAQAGKRNAAVAKTEPQQISAAALCFGLGCILVALGLFVLPMTGSQGGIALGFAAPAAVALGGMMWKQVVRWRRVLIPVCVGAILLGGLGAVLYGVRHDTLPSKSLMFRWHYWTASVPIIREHAAWGVGLNNFGDYYLQFKRPSSPEDVKDPHNFFVRLASEMGIPAMALLTGLVVWMIAGALRPVRGDTREDDDEDDRPALWLAVLVGGVWVIAHLLYFEAALEFNVYITIIFAMLAVGAFHIGMTLLRPGGGDDAGAGPSTGFPILKYLAVAAAVGAVAMLVYDQINMALVTGPVAMLFWMMLGFADAGEGRWEGDASGAAARPRLRLPAWLAAGGFGAGALVLMLGLWVPVVQRKMAWDPSPHEEASVLAIQRGDMRAARANLEAALARWPRSMEIRMRLIAVMNNAFAGEPLADQIREALSLDRANAQAPLQLGMMDTDLPPAERIAALERALHLDTQLPADEPKRLKPDMIAQVRGKIAELRQAVPASSSAPAPGR